MTGKPVVPEKIHPSIKGVRNAQSSGAAVVSFNAEAYESFGREQNINAPVGKYATFAYTTALNYLLSDYNHKKQFGDATVVYWAEDAEDQYQDLFGEFLEGDTVSDKDLDDLMERLSGGNTVDMNGIPLHPENQFYILALAPNAARISVRFFYHSTFGDLVKNLKEHYDRLKITGRYENRPLPLWRLLNETVRMVGGKAQNDPLPQMSGDVLRAMLTGGNYPATLYQQTQLRIRAERDVTDGRAAIVKAYLLKNSKNGQYKEALTVELNEKTVYQPYVLGRMFSVLEAIQQSANPGLNTTIKDKYFTSACATPALVFPNLIALSEKHMRKLGEGSRIYYSKMMADLMAMIDSSYPSHHTLNEQGIFQLGYYHQTKKRYEKKNADNSGKEDK